MCSCSFPAKDLNELKQELELDVHKVDLEELCKRFNTNVDTGLTQEAVLEGQQKYGKHWATSFEKKYLESLYPNFFVTFSLLGTLFW